MEELFLKLVNMSLTASWLVLAVLIFRLVLKKAPKSIHCILWGLVALRLIFPFSIESVLSLIPSAEPLPEEFLYAATPQVNTGITALNSVINPVVAETLTPAELTSANPTQVWSFVFSWVWVIGMAVMAVYALVSYLLIRRKAAASIPVGKTIRLCDHIDTPFILGIIRPKIYLPSSIDQQTADHVLAHENAHLQRKDHWWKPLGFALLTVYWFNPVMWLAYILLCRDIEMACDEKVVKDLDTAHKKAYSQALLQCSVPRHLIAACPLAFGEVGVKSRIRSVLNYRKPAFWIIVVAVIACIVVAVCFLTDPAESGSVEIIDDLVRIEDITSENGYTILNQATKNINITIPKSALPDSIYSEKGHTFGVDEIVVYETDTTVFYLDSVRFANEGEDLLYFKFNAMYDLPEAGTITLLYEVLDEETTRHIMWVSLQSIFDGKKKYDNAVSIRGEDGGTSFTVYVNTEVCKAAEEYLSFRVDNFTELTYAPEGYDPVDAALLVEKRLPAGSYVCSDCVYWPLYSSTLRPNTGPYNFLVYKDSISYYYSTSGTVFEEYTVDWQWQTLAQRYEDAFFYIQWYEDFASELSMDVPVPSEATLYQPLDGEHLLIKSDGVVYMVEGTAQGKNAPMVYVDAIYRVGRIELTSGETSAPNEEPVGASSLDEAIRAAILKNNTSGDEGAVFESHTILSQLIACGVVPEGTTEPAPCGYTEVCVIAMLMHADQTEKGFEVISREMIPVKLTFDEYTDGSYVLTDYWQADNGEDPDAAITEHFSPAALEDFTGIDSYTTILTQSCYAQAVQHYGLNTDVIIEDLLYTICSSPAQYSNPQPYLEAHPEEYDALIGYGEYTLQYCFREFLSETSGGIKAEVMAAACREIGTVMGEDISFTGQYLNGNSWFAVFRANVEALYETHTMDVLESSNHASWVLLKLLEATPMPIA